jgi:hypothetical protein
VCGISEWNCVAPATMHSFASSVCMRRDSCAWKMGARENFFIFLRRFSHCLASFQFQPDTTFISEMFLGVRKVFHSSPEPRLRQQDSPQLSRWGFSCYSTYVSGSFLYQHYGHYTTWTGRIVVMHAMSHPHPHPHPESKVIPPTSPLPVYRAQHLAKNFVFGASLYSSQRGNS